MLVDDEPDATELGTPNHRRILKVRLRQDLVLRLHEQRILQGKSIATLLEHILQRHFATGATNGSNGPSGSHPSEPEKAEQHG